MWTSLFTVGTILFSWFVIYEQASSCLFFFIWGAKIIWMIILSLPRGLLKKKLKKEKELSLWHEVEYYCAQWTCHVMLLNECLRKCVLPCFLPFFHSPSYLKNWFSYTYTPCPATVSVSCQHNTCIHNDNCHLPFPWNVTRLSKATILTCKPSLHQPNLTYSKITVSEIKTTNRCAEICAFRRCRAPASLHRLPCCFHWRRDQVSRDGNDRSRLIAKMASAETAAESERGMTIFLDVSYRLYILFKKKSSQ